MPTFAEQKIWISTTYDMILYNGNLYQWRIEESTNIPINSSLNISAIFGYYSYFKGGIL
jgi:hypothetical protein